MRTIDEKDLRAGSVIYKQTKDQVFPHNNEIKIDFFSKFGSRIYFFFYFYLETCGLFYLHLHFTIYVYQMSHPGIVGALRLKKKTKANVLIILRSIYADLLFQW